MKGLWQPRRNDHPPIIFEDLSYELNLNTQRRLEPERQGSPLISGDIGAQRHHHQRFRVFCIADVRSPETRLSTFEIC